MPVFQNSEKTTEYPGSARRLKNGLKGLFNPERLGQVRKAIIRSKIEAPGSSINLLACFGQKCEITVFEGTNWSQPFPKNVVFFFAQDFFILKIASRNDRKNLWVNF
jgi:hypothetical protein